MDESDSQDVVLFMDDSDRESNNSHDEENDEPGNDGETENSSDENYVNNSDMENEYEESDVNEENDRESEHNSEYCDEYEENIDEVDGDSDGNDECDTETPYDGVRYNDGISENEDNETTNNNDSQRSEKFEMDINNDHSSLEGDGNINREASTGIIGLEEEVQRMVSGSEEEARGTVLVIEDEHQRKEPQRMIREFQLGTDRDKIQRPQETVVVEVDVHRDTKERNNVPQKEGKVAGRFKHQEKKASETDGQNIEKDGQNEDGNWDSKMDGQNKEQKHRHGSKEVSRDSGRDFGRKNNNQNNQLDQNKSGNSTEKSGQENSRYKKDDRIKEREFKSESRYKQKNREYEQNERECKEDRTCQQDNHRDKQECGKFKQDQKRPEMTKDKEKQWHSQYNTESKQEIYTFRQENNQLKSQNNKQKSNRGPNKGDKNKITPNSSSQTPKKPNQGILNQSERSNNSNENKSASNISIKCNSNNSSNKSSNNYSQNKNKGTNNNNNNNNSNQNINKGNKNNSTIKVNNNHSQNKNTGKGNNNNNTGNNNQNTNKGNKDSNSNNNGNKNNSSNSLTFEPKTDFLNPLKKILSTWYIDKKPCHNPIDSSVLRLHYRMGVCIFLILYTCIFARWYIGSTIHCVSLFNTEARVSDFVRNFCLSYSYVCSSEQPRGEGCPRRYLLFYRWLPYSFLILSGLYYIPRIVAKMKDNPRLIKLVRDLAAGEHRYEGTTWHEDTELMINYLSKHHHTHTSLYFWLIFSHMLALVIDIGTFLFFDFTLQGRFLGLIISAYPYTRDPQNFTDELSTLFPPFVNCTLEPQVLINNERTERLACHLLVMELYEKVFFVLWFWLAFVTICTAVSVSFLLLACIPPFKWAFLHTHTNSSGIRKLKRKMYQHCDVADLYVLYLMKQHRSEAQFIMFMSRYSHSHEDSAEEMESGEQLGKMHQLNEKQPEKLYSQMGNHSLMEDINNSIIMIPAM